jgi:CDP-6-deoxy-D-xylo-4-hexulose-3-dehydrase
MEGGGVATNDSDYADDLRSIRSHGWSRDRYDANEWQESYTKSDSKFLFVSTGFNVRPMEIQAAIGISQIGDISHFIDKRRSLARRVSRSLLDTGVRLVGSDVLDNVDSAKCHSWMLLPIQVIGVDSRGRKLSMILELEKLGIETRPVLTGNFVSQPAMKRIGQDLPDPAVFESANLISETTFLVSCHHELTDEQIQYLCESLKVVALKHKD